MYVPVTVLTKVNLLNYEKLVEVYCCKIQVKISYLDFYATELYFKLEKHIIKNML